jgi:DNA-binding response OmpR family regulator
VCTFEELLAEIWGTADIPAHKRKLEAAIHRVRTRIQEVDGSGWKYIENVRGKGYRYVPRPE